MRTTRYLLVFALFMCGCSTASISSISPRPVGVSQPVTVNEVQSAIVWVHPTDPSKSLLFITNEKKGLQVHSPTGVMLEHEFNGICPVYVDVIYDFDLGGTKTDLLVASCQGEGATGVHIWAIDANKGKLSSVTTAEIIKVFDGGVPIGLCTYRSHKTGKSYFFVTMLPGEIEQYELICTSDKRIDAKRVRTMRTGSKVKGSMADEELGYVYFAEQKVGVQRFDAEPDGSATPTLVIRANEHGLVPSVKGPALYGARGGKGYLLVVSQGKKGIGSIINVYERSGDYAYVATITPGGDPLEHSSGLAVTNQSLGPPFEKGLLMVNDQFNPTASEDFKLFRWFDVAGPGHLITDTVWSRRQ